MSMTWILIANRTNARLFTTLIDDEGRVSTELVREFDHPKGSLKDQDISTDRPGVALDHGYGKHAMAKGQSPAEHEDQRFAKELAETLAQGRTDNAFRRLVLIAEPGFLGLLKGALDDQTAKLLTDTVPKNLTDMPDREVSEFILERIRG